MKTMLKALLRRLAQVAVIGRFIRIAAALYRLPSSIETMMRINANLESLARQVAMAQQARADAEASWRQGGQADVVATTRDLDNLVLSVPVALRELRRDVNRLQAILADLPPDGGTRR